MAEGVNRPTEAKGLQRGVLASFLLVVVGFTLTSTAYLSWLYRLMEFVPTQTADALTMVGGYCLQAAGLAIMAAVGRRWPGAYSRVSFVFVVALHFACAVPATLGTTFVGVLAFGYLQNVLCGVIAAHYLHSLSEWVPAERRGIVFGGGYACSILISWALSHVVPAGTGGILESLAPCLALSIAAASVALLPGWGSQLEQERPASSVAIDRAVFAFACFAVLLMSLVKNMGFSFPAADIAAGVDLELSRLFYGAGLVIAGIVVDRSRKMGAICCMAALVTPFVGMALANESLPGTAMWAIDYFFYGFFSVFRIVLFADIASDSKRAYLSGFGLMIGRIGDALGTAAYMTLGNNSIALVAVAAVLFATTVFVVSRLAQLIFIAPEAALPKSGEQLFDEFSMAYGLSSREREVMKLLLAERSNAEIASELFVTEGTIKFHVRNILKKTGCKNRQELRTTYLNT